MVLESLNDDISIVNQNIDLRTEPMNQA